MTKFLAPSPISVVAGAVLLTAGLLAGLSAEAADSAPLAQRNGIESGPLPNSTLSRPEYEMQIQLRIDRMNNSPRELRTAMSKAMDVRLSSTSSSWRHVQQQWEAIRSANDAGWPAAGDAQSASYTELNGIWEETFGQPLDGDAPVH